MFGEEDIDPELIDDLYKAVETTAWEAIEDVIISHDGTIDHEADGELTGYDKYGYMAVICRPDIFCDDNECDIIVVRNEDYCDIYRVNYGMDRKYEPYWTKHVRWEDVFGAYVRSSDKDII